MPILNYNNKIDKIIALFYTEKLLISIDYQIDVVLKQINDEKLLNESRSFLVEIAESLRKNLSSNGKHSDYTNQKLLDFAKNSRQLYAQEEAKELFDNLLVVFNLESSEYEELHSEVIEKCFHFVFNLFLKRLYKQEVAAQVLEVVQLCMQYLVLVSEHINDNKSNKN